MNKFSIAIHGGASESSSYLEAHIKEYEAGLKEAILIGHNILKRGGSSMLAVEESVKALEDNSLFNAGRGSALNYNAEVEMDAAIMNGKNNKAGAVSMVKNVKNPILLARNVMLKTNHVFLSGYGAIDFAKTTDIRMEPDAYFITELQYHNYLDENKRSNLSKMLRKPNRGTVGAVAVDIKGNLAAATSTGGTTNCLPGRIGDSCVIGAGCFADNNTCAVSGTGTGEVLITNVIAHTISMIVELTQCSIQEACDYVILKRKRVDRGEIGVIAVDPKGHIGISFNTEIMKRAWMSQDGKLHVKIFS